jgi:small nuclear ribonucleoprotein (snRNP)-like protein
MVYKIGTKKFRKESKALDKAFIVLKRNKVVSIKLKDGEEVKL